MNRSGDGTRIGEKTICKMAKEVLSPMTNVSWNERIQDELVWHLSAKQALNKEEQTELWALADGNSRGLKQAQKAYYHTERKQDAVVKVWEELDSAVKTYRSDEFIIESDDEEFAEMVSEGYVQGMVRAYTIALGLHTPNEPPPQDLSAFGNKLLTEVNNATA